MSATRGYHPTYNDGVMPYTSPVGSFAANGYGLYDMAGNVWQRCWDWSGSYTAASQVDPRGPLSCLSRVSRGSAWGSFAMFCRVAFRGTDDPVYYANDEGFRRARTLDP